MRASSPPDRETPIVLWCAWTRPEKQLIAETCAPIPAKPGQPARHDYQYERNGVANLFMIFAPLEGWRRVEGTTATPQSITRKSSKTYPMGISPPPRKSCSSRTT